MPEFINSLAEKYGLFVIGGAIGAIIHRLRKKMSFTRFIASITISMFVALCTGVISQEYFLLPQSIIYVLCGISGVFSEVILDEIEEVIKNVSSIIKSRFGVPKDDEQIL